MELPIVRCENKVHYFFKYDYKLGPKDKNAGKNFRKNPITKTSFMHIWIFRYMRYELDRRYMCFTMLKKIPRFFGIIPSFKVT